MEDELSLIINEVPLRGYFVIQCQEEKRSHHEHLILGVVKRRGIYNEENKLQTSHAINKQYLDV
jgi:hypothetical protein